MNITMQKKIEEIELQFFQLRKKMGSVEDTRIVELDRELKVLKKLKV